MKILKISSKEKLITLSDLNLPPLSTAVFNHPKTRFLWVLWTVSKNVYSYIFYINLAKLTLFMLQN